MSLEIQFVDRTQTPAVLVNSFTLRQLEEEWLIPEVVLSPVDRLPLLSRVTITVSGAPEAAARRIGAVYTNKTFAPPRQVSRRVGLGGGQLPNAGPLPPETACELQVSAAYYEADSQNRPTGAEKTVSATCRLQASGQSGVASELALRPRQATVILGEPASLSVEVANPRGGLPVLRLLYPQSLIDPQTPNLAALAGTLAELRPALESALGASPSAGEKRGSVEEYRFTFTVAAPPSVGNELSRLRDGLTVPFQVEYSEARPVQGLLRIETRQQAFPGWVVIDLGTTNSTVTVHDNWPIVPVQGLPEEQEAVLRQKMAAWLNASAAEALGGGRKFDADWQRLRTTVARTNGLSGPEALPAGLTASRGNLLYEVLAQVELSLRTFPEPFRRAVSVALTRLYREALHVPPLRHFKLFPIKLDLDTNQESVGSDLEILKVEDNGVDDRWVSIQMGKKAQRNRLEAIAQAEEVSLEQVRQRFHPSPKRYFGRRHPGFPVVVDGRRVEVSVDQLMRAGWQHLIALADRARAADLRFSKGPFRRVVITYPTVAPPSVRQKIHRLVRDLNIADVRTDYDEAVASAIFYFMREYSSYPELGLESFKAHCRTRTESEWTQHVLVFDVGGGTTDVALIRFTMTEEPVFEPGEDRGAGGRYYKVTPKLLGSTGESNLGGELMTLRIFRLLKGLIADRLLSLTQEQKLRCEPLKTLLSAGGLPEEAVDAKGRYSTGWIPRIIEEENPDGGSSRLRDALDLAERVLPTRWGRAGENRLGRLQAFYTLWEYAEEAKKKLGSKPLGNLVPVSLFELKADRLEVLLQQCYGEDSYQSPDKNKDLRILLSVDQMEKAIEKVVEDAVEKACEMLERLGKGEMVDWLILSGQSCNLALVDRKIRSNFEKADKFIWNPERVTFLPDYAKLSTSLGACYAEVLRRNRFSPRDSGTKKDARRGINTLYFDINNLFSYLPCKFVISLPGGERSLFNTGQELFDLDGIDNEDEQRAKARSDWQGAALKIAVYRKDSSKGNGRPWGHFDGQHLVNKLGLGEKQWLEQVKLQFEIDHQQLLQVLACRLEEGQSEPDYIVTGKEPLCDLTAGLRQAAARSAPGRSPAADPAGSPAPGRSAPQAVPVLPALFDEKGELQWTVAVGDNRSPSLTLFKAGEKLATRFRPEGGGESVRRGMRSAEPVKDFLDTGWLFVWGRTAGSDVWSPLGQIQRPGGKPTFRRYYRASLDQDGQLRLHCGEMRYWESADDTVLRDRPGCVYRMQLAPPDQDAEKQRDPFSGEH
jgi:molecular chaperone DnaK (HSP70)